MVNLKRGSKKSKEKDNKGKKEINLNISLTNRWLYTLVAVVVLLIAGVGVYAYSQSIPNPGHGGDSVLVSVGDEEMTLQDAINQEKLGGGSSDGGVMEWDNNCRIATSRCKYSNCPKLQEDQVDDRNHKGDRYSEVSCNNNEFRVSGGCRIGDHDGNSIGSSPVDNGWRCNSGGISSGDIKSYAICCETE